MIPVNLKIVVAKPGARGDFLAGWLGTLDYHIDNQWRIDPTTGRSHGLMNRFKDIDKSSDTLYQMIKSWGYSLDVTSHWTLSMSCHLISVVDKIHSSELPAAKIIQVLTNKVAPETLAWEFIAKTFFGAERYESSIASNLLWNIDKFLPDATIQDQIEYIKKTAQYIYSLPAEITHPLSVTVDYTTLFQPGGSKYLCDCLKLTASPRHHLLWDQNLMLAESLNEYQYLGLTWTRQNFLT